MSIVPAEVHENAIAAITKMSAGVAYSTYTEIVESEAYRQGSHQLHANSVELAHAALKQSMGAEGGKPAGRFGHDGGLAPDDENEGIEIDRPDPLNGEGGRMPGMASPKMRRDRFRAAMFTWSHALDIEAKVTLAPALLHQVDQLLHKVDDDDALKAELTENRNTLKAQMEAFA